MNVLGGGYGMTKEELYNMVSMIHSHMLIWNKDLDIEAVTQDGKQYKIFQKWSFAFKEASVRICR